MPVFSSQIHQELWISVSFDHVSTCQVAQDNINCYFVLQVGNEPDELENDDD